MHDRRVQIHPFIDVAGRAPSPDLTFTMIELFPGPTQVSYGV